MKLILARHRYTYKLNIAAGKLSDVRAIDDQGETIGTPTGSLSAGSKEQTVTIQVDQAAYGVSLWAFTTDSKVEVSYNIASTTLPAGGPTQTAKPNAAVRVTAQKGAIFALAGAAAVLCL